MGLEKYSFNWIVVKSQVHRGSCAFFQAITSFRFVAVEMSSGFFLIRADLSPEFPLPRFCLICYSF